jgi:hypothetical protein
MLSRLLGHYDLVRPQNYFDPLPLHARWDSARILLNRAMGGDFPGTLGIRGGFLRAAGGYAGDALFENLQLIRTVEAHGGKVANAMDLHVRRLPPSLPHFLQQRVRNAYEEFAFPLRMAAGLAVLPAAIRLRRRPRLLALAAALPVLLALRGRQRRDGRRFFPLTSAFLAPLWLLERGTCAWFALACRLGFGGVPYNGKIVSKAADSKEHLMRARSSRVSR